MIDALAALAPTPLIESELDALCRRCCVSRLYLFGSAVNGEFDLARSDLDFLVTFEPAPPKDYAKTYFELYEGLIALFGRDVDLVIETDMKNPYFRARVLSERQLVFET